ncbi:DUF423 domain-containing protein [Oricola thermophila]|uniref:DUF423 domain-containing protein n=1 Tax=Oricola thermophila TaxID=2742145 RepID=A0A6N1VHQ6_9HYPH|nr:DUF423 domain-containing protein [Oricola thermophila]QKV18852.1 DUF423 domain-containing protein [Oricola thermophila]
MDRQDGNGAAVLAGAGVLGFAGVAAAAASAHAGSDPRLMSAAALVCLTHAPALLAIGLLGRGAVLLRLAAVLLFVGAALFASDMALREFGQGRLFAMAAPTGGIAMMAGWLAVAGAAFRLRR